MMTVPPMIAFNPDRAFRATQTDGITQAELQDKIKDLEKNQQQNRNYQLQINQLQRELQSVKEQAAAQIDHAPARLEQAAVPIEQAAAIPIPAVNEQSAQRIKKLEEKAAFAEGAEEADEKIEVLKKQLAVHNQP